MSSGQQASTASIRESSFADLLVAGAELFTEHWDEVAQQKHLMRFAPDTDQYYALEKAGRLLVLGAYLGDELIGYSVTFVFEKHLHYQHLSYAQNDVLFISKTHRKGRLGARLIWETERRAKARGARMMLWHAKEHPPELKELLPKLGYSVQDIIFSRELT